MGNNIVNMRANNPDCKDMNQKDNNNRLEQLEILYSEQENTIDALNQVVTSQTLELEELRTQLRFFKQQLEELKDQLPTSGAVGNEKPPHY